MTQVEIGTWIEEAFKREGVGRDSWSFSDPEHSSVNDGMDIQVNFELKYRGTPEQSEKLSLLAPRTLGAPDSSAQIEVFIEGVREKVRTIKGRIRPREERSEVSQWVETEDRLPEEGARRLAFQTTEREFIGHYRKGRFVAETPATFEGGSTEWEPQGIVRWRLREENELP